MTNIFSITNNKIEIDFIIWKRGLFNTTEHSYLPGSAQGTRAPPLLLKLKKDPLIILIYGVLVSYMEKSN